MQWPRYLALYKIDTRRIRACATCECRVIWREKRKSILVINMIMRTITFLVILINLLIGLGSTQAKGNTKVQVLTGKIEPGRFIIYLLPNLKHGDRLFVYMKGTSGNLDPGIGLIDASLDLVTLEKEYRSAIERATSAGQDPLAAIQEIRNKYFLIWDDDSGGGYAAAFEFKIPNEGDYRLVAGGALSAAIGRMTFGDYQLLIGLDAPNVLTGKAEPTGETIAILDKAATRAGIRVQEIKGELTSDKTSTFFALNDFNPDDTLYVFIEATSGDLIPTIVLHDYGKKPVRSGNLEGKQRSGSFKYTFKDGGRNYTLEVSSCCKGEKVTTGGYRLLVGVNTPEVLTGKAVNFGNPVIRRPIEVQVGVKLQQIIQVDQQSEFFHVVATMQMEWTDPALAFSPDTCQCRFKVFTEENFNQFITETGGRWPDFTLYNQQGRRWTQNQYLVILPDGHATYSERFTTNFQTDFDFRKFPFDTQPFLIRIDLLSEEEYYVFSDLKGFSEISKEHGEDEFIISKFDTDVSSQKTSTEWVSSRFTFRFEAPRHLDYYIFRIFIPVFLIIIVTFITFFLNDYVKRIEIASANLLLFIAFSFSLSENYPRLGYLTFLDGIMAITFVINAFAVIYNVYLKWLEMNNKRDKAEHIDKYMDWFYPSGFVLALLTLIIVFF